MSLSSQPAFEASLAQPLNFGHILEISGKIRQDADSVYITLSKSKSSSSDSDEQGCLQIHLNFVEKQMIFSQSIVNNKCSHAINKELILAEFLNEFIFYIMLAETKFHIALNNKPLINFKYNLDVAKLEIKFIKIVGKLEYIRQLDHHKYFPYTWPPIQIVNDYLDFSNDQPVSFKPGHVLVITAKLEGNSKGRFIIHFLHGRDNKRQELHVSVRFDTRKIIRTVKYRQADDILAFGPEEIDDICVFPFEDFHKPFKLAIAFCETQFRFAKDGQFLFNFSYRSPVILPHIMGPKIFGTNGVNVRVWEVQHLSLENEHCQDFEKYSALF